LLIHTISYTYIIKAGSSFVTIYTGSAQPHKIVNYVAGCPVISLKASSAISTR